jgi:putative sigma-54 modulation protein
MNVYKLVGRHVEVTEALKSYLDKKLSRLDRYAQQVVDAKVVLSVEHSPHVRDRAEVEIQLNIPGGMVRVEESDPDMYAAIDKSVDRLEHQLKRYKERHFSRRNAMAVPEPVLVGGPVFEEPEPELPPQIVRFKRFALRPMTPEDAAFEMEALGHDFYMFRSAETEEICVIYRRRDGNYGLLEPGT